MAPSTSDEAGWPVGGRRTGIDVFQTLASGKKREVRGCTFQAHVCAISSLEDVHQVIAAFSHAEAFKAVASWCYAFRLDDDQGFLERSEDGLDEGAGQRILEVMRRFALQGLLLLVSRWQDYGASPGLEMLGTELYSVVTERCKDLIVSLKNAMGYDQGMTLGKPSRPPKLPPAPKSFDFATLPSLPEPAVPPKYSKNHFMSELLARSPRLLQDEPSSGDLVGGDVRMWMANDRCLQNLPDSELWSLRSMRQPDARLERVLTAVALLMGRRAPSSASTPAARWCLCKEVLRSNTLRTELLLFDSSRVPSATAKAVLQLLERLEIDDVRRVSEGAAALYEWARGVAKWRMDGGPPPSPSAAELAPARRTFGAPSFGCGALQRAASETLLAGRRSTPRRPLEKRGAPGTFMRYNRSHDVLAS